MVILWFFLAVSWNGEVTAFHGFPNEEDCSAKQQQYTKMMKNRMRDITDCIGVPIKGDRR